ncbi:MAG: hypothetical protein IJW23_12550 [Lentisphaeria bacterium]|nr:hypothetical protein [Lentisphaeria bacterium]
MKKTVFVLLLASFFALSADDLGEIAKKYWTGWKKNKPELRVRNLTPAQMQERRVDYLKTVKKYAPHWLKEFEAVDRAMGWKPGTYLDISLFGINYWTTTSPHECTSWTVLPDMTDGKNLILHKNRDTNAHYITGIRRNVPGKFSWIGMGSYGNIGVNAGVNEKGLAVVMNSADESKDRSSSGFGTTQLARLMLEECPSAEKAVKYLAKMIDEGAYRRGAAGSIWFIADSREVYVFECSAKHYFYKKITAGVGIRSNVWHLPEMAKYSTREISELIKHTRREFEIRRGLLHNVAHKGKKITPLDIARTSRIHVPDSPKKFYPLCGFQTVSGSTFVLDREFPEDLSFCWFAFGPPKHIFYIPFPITLDALQDSICDGTFNDRAFKRFKKGNWKDETELEAVEAQIYASYMEAMEKARAILKAGGKDAKARAAAILKEAFWKNWNFVLKAEQIDSRNWFEKLFDL